MRTLVFAIDRNWEQDREHDSVVLACAAQFVCQDTFSSNPFTGSFDDKCQKKSVPHLLLALYSVYSAGRPKYQGPKSCEYAKQEALSNFCTDY